MEQPPPGIFVIDNVLDESRVDELIDKVLSMAEERTDRTFTKVASFQNGKVLTDELNKELMERVQEHLPKVYTNKEGKRFELVKPCNYVFYSIVNRGESFSIHTDTGSHFDDAEKMSSRFTLLIYLTGPPDYTGGDTLFYDDDIYLIYKCAPKRNRALVFDIDYFHAGGKVEGEGKKIWIGTEIVCRQV
jgi:predicted 2-oxoglutarate/Fe(II)-dependent dioxygenase YbiX